jgi:hypothetical protein
MWLVPNVWNLMRCCFLKEKTNVVSSKCMKPEMLFPKRQRMWWVSNVWNPIRCFFLKEETNIVGPKCM